MIDCIFAIDLGTSGPKVALISLEGEVLAWTFAATQLIFLPNGGVEQKPQEWWQKICQASRQLLSRKDISRYKIQAIATTAQWSCIVPVDAKGNPLSNAISWMDTRGAAALKKTFKGLIHYRGYDIKKILKWLWLTNGLPGSSGKDSLAHILYFKEQEAAIYQKTYKFLEAKDYLNACLTGRFAATPDSITLYWLTNNRKANKIYYHPYLLKVTDIALDKLPELVPPVQILGHLKPHPARELALPSGLPVITGTPDLHSAAIGSGGIANYDAHLYLGTSSWLSCHLSLQKVSFNLNMATIPSALPGKYLVGNAQESAGYCLKHFIENLSFPPPSPHKPKDPYQWLNSLAESAPPGAGKVIYTPWLVGERTPVENKTIRGGFHNLSGNTQQAHLARAVFEGVAYNSRWLLESAEKFTNRTFPYLRLIGGGAMSDLWCQIHADILNREIHRVAQPRLANLRGVALLAGLALGKLNISQMVSKIKIDRVFYPHSQYHNLYQELYQEFRNIYHKEKNIYARLNQNSNNEE